MNIKMGIAKAGIKPSGDYDILVLKFKPSVYSVVLTQNSLAAAPVIYDRMIASMTDKISSIVINSGNANAATGEKGLENTEKMANIVAENFDIDSEQVMVFSTGIIGVQLPMEKVEKGINEACNNMQDLDLKKASTAIMTTDSFPKYYETTGEIDGKQFVIRGIAKGAGMIHPNMATMLAYIFTDVKIDKWLLDKTTKLVAERSFNSIDVDGCESTNDSFLVVATGESDVEINDTNRTYFAKKLLEVATELAKMIVKDGEGATKLIQINIHQARDNKEAKKIAEAIALSNLFKTAMFGNDPNWGRILSAVGQLHLDIDFNKVDLYLGEFLLYSGKPNQFDREKAVEYLKINKEITIDLYFGRGDGNWTYYTCDLSYKYVEINAEYTT
ncbi:bifunctional glutamate N-acetyltransferase/amino-acid acetyltransferase ArgJ [Hydrogenothermus marinus]|uniref:Arginine biosynthesis bifunctional protein ArgJ n=1 Tax=Hydrogenothermus marinus TaxID=133270 RepID=A0A3M0BLZ0_9AQUI|nr:bifunctional glutamate N-acetyltransferase/amino-acid acetyltransferase ArgJ [Hydrogenothermus marinus]RMA97299.1 glutamate N-acetyltransferase [Hydrogenothermus marinus]